MSRQILAGQLLHARRNRVHRSGNRTSGEQILGHIRVGGRRWELLVADAHEQAVDTAANRFRFAAIFGLEGVAALLSTVTEQEVEPALALL
jgi:hypothetical protein